jgi:hypothetical protein
MGMCVFIYFAVWGFLRKEREGLDNQKQSCRKEKKFDQRKRVSKVKRKDE